MVTYLDQLRTSTSFRPRAAKRSALGWPPSEANGAMTVRAPTLIYMGAHAAV